MLHSFLLMLTLLSATAPASPVSFNYPVTAATGSSIGAFIPSGWTVIDTARGDLDKDRLADYAVVLEYPSQVALERMAGGEKIEIEGRPRILLVLLASRNGTLKRSCQSNTIILSESEGGVMGDPFDGVTIEKGTLVIPFWGGSADKWNLSYRFRYQQGDWFMIGATSGGGNAAQSYRYDYNLLTGKIVIMTSKGRRERVTRKAVRPRSLPRLATYEPWSMVISDEMVF